MHDAPGPSEILAAVARLLRDELMPALHGDLAFKLRVAVNALDLVRRQADEDPMVQAAHVERLRALVGGGDDDATRRLAVAIAEGAPLPQPLLEEELWATTLAKLEVDQPDYAKGREAHPLPTAKRDA